jgi:hypothetical protein
MAGITQRGAPRAERNRYGRYGKSNVLDFGRFRPILPPEADVASAARHVSKAPRRDRPFEISRPCCLIRSVTQY